MSHDKILYKENRFVLPRAREGKGDCGWDIMEQYWEGPVVIKRSYILTMVADA